MAAATSGRPSRKASRTPVEEYFSPSLSATAAATDTLKPNSSP